MGVCYESIPYGDQCADPRTVDDTVQYLEHTGRHWVDNFILPTITIHQFIRAKREGDRILQQLCLERMLPYFFAAGHFHYATSHNTCWKCAICRNEPKMKSRWENLYGGIRQASGIQYSLISFREQTAIRIGKGGLRGVTPDLVKEWIDCSPIAAYV